MKKKRGFLWCSGVVWIVLVNNTTRKRRRERKKRSHKGQHASMFKTLNNFINELHPFFLEVLSYPFSIRSPTLTYKYFLIKKKKLGLKENKILTWLVRFFAVNSFILRSACFYQGGFFFFFFSHFVWLVSVDRILKKETILKILNSLFLCIFNLICGLMGHFIYIYTHTWLGDDRDWGVL